MNLFIFALVNACARDWVVVDSRRAEQIGESVAMAFCMHAGVPIICQARIADWAEQRCIFDDCVEALVAKRH